MSTKRIEFFRREDDAGTSGVGLDAGGKASLNGDGGRLWGFKVGLELERVKVVCRGASREREMTGRMGSAALRTGWARRADEGLGERIDRAMASRWAERLTGGEVDGEGHEGGHGGALPRRRSRPVKTSCPLPQ